MAEHRHGATAAVQGIADAAKGAAEGVMDQARAAGAALQGEAGGLASTLRQGLESQAEQQKHRIADRIGQLADRVQRSADGLRDEEAWLARLMERGARELGGVADDIARNDVAGILGSAEVFARRQPALFVGAAVALGFALTRVVRSGDDPSRGYPGRDRSDTADEFGYYRASSGPVGVRRSVPGMGATEPDLSRGVNS